jgi:hypothetical protein
MDRQEFWKLGADPTYYQRSLFARAIMAKTPPAKMPPVERRAARKRDEERRKKSVPPNAPARRSRAVDMARLERQVARLEAGHDVAHQGGSVLSKVEQAIAWKMGQIDPVRFAAASAVCEVLDGQLAMSRGGPADSPDRAGLGETSLGICKVMGVSPREFANARMIEEMMPGPFAVERPGDNWRAPAPAIDVDADGFGRFQVER